MKSPANGSYLPWKLPASNAAAVIRLAREFAVQSV